jgi:hypothetical protein
MLLVSNGGPVSNVEEGGQDADPPKGGWVVRVLGSTGGDGTGVFRGPDQVKWDPDLEKLHVRTGPSFPWTTIPDRFEWIGDKPIGAPGRQVTFHRMLGAGPPVPPSELTNEEIAGHDEVTILRRRAERAEQAWKEASDSRDAWIKRFEGAETNTRAVTKAVQPYVTALEDLKRFLVQADVVSETVSALESPAFLVRAAADALGDRIPHSDRETIQQLRKFGDLAELLDILARQRDTLQQARERFRSLGLEDPDFNVLLIHAATEIQRLRVDLAAIRGASAELASTREEAKYSAEEADGLRNGWPAATQAERDVLVERAKQRRKWGDAHDDEEHLGGLPYAAAFLATSSAEVLEWYQDPGYLSWAVEVYNKHRRRERYVIAAALLVAEIDRLDRAESAASEDPSASVVTTFRLDIGPAPVMTAREFAWVATESAESGSPVGDSGASVDEIVNPERWEVRSTVATVTDPLSYSDSRIFEPPAGEGWEPFAGNGGGVLWRRKVLG